MGFSSSGSYPLVFHEVCFYEWDRLTLQLNPGIFLFGFLLFLIIFLYTFQEAVLALRIRNVFNMYINSLAKNLALNLFTTPTTC